MMDALRYVIAGALRLCETPILVYFLLINTSYLVLMLAAAYDFGATCGAAPASTGTRRRPRRWCRG